MFKFYYKRIMWYNVRPSILWISDGLRNWTKSFDNVNNTFYGGKITYKEYKKKVKDHASHHAWLLNKYPLVNPDHIGGTSNWFAPPGQH